MSGVLPVVQFRGRAGLVDLGWGHPRPALLPVEQWALASAEALREYGPAALAYGHATGPGPLLCWLGDRLAVPAGELFVTAGASHALDLVCSLLVTRADTVLVDAPTYHIAPRIIADHAGAVVPAPVEEPGAVADLIGALRAAGRSVPLLYLVPTFNNPTGGSLVGRAALVDVARRTGIAIIEDDTYRELGYDGEPPPALYDLAGGAPVIRIGSFAKTVAPGLRLGWISAEPALVARLAGRGYVHSGGGVNHATAMAMATFGGSGAYDRHLAQIRAAYGTARDALVAAVHQHLPEAELSRPAGGWFLWLRLPGGVDTDELVPVAEAHGVSYLPGSRFYPQPYDHSDSARPRPRRDPEQSRRCAYLRLSFSMLEPDMLVHGVVRLASAIAAL